MEQTYSWEFSEWQSDKPSPELVSIDSYELIRRSMETFIDDPEGFYIWMQGFLAGRDSNG